METDIGVLLINIGTPDTPAEGDVKIFLSEFLSDPYVVDYPRWFWNLVLNRIILKVRPAKSARLYAKIWTEAGSPLLYKTKLIAEKIQKELPGVFVAVGMRYGNPSIGSAVQELKQAGVRQLVILPVFPQYTSSTSLTAIEAARAEISSMDFDKAIIIEEYHDNLIYIRGLASSIRKVWQEAGGKTEKTLFSFHGVPQRYITKKGEPYQEQCLITASLAAKELGLSDEEYQVSFQSRFGPEEWLTPYTDAVLARLGTEKCRGLSVVCPGFAVDCLETLEEIAVQGKEVYEDAGGSGFIYVPALNETDEHIDALVDVIQNAVSNG